MFQLALYISTDNFVKPNAKQKLQSAPYFEVTASP